MMNPDAFSKNCISFSKFKVTSIYILANLMASNLSLIFQCKMRFISCALKIAKRSRSSWAIIIRFWPLFHRILTLYEAKSLVALLHIKDCGTLERALVTISSSAAFTQNQDSLREAGCIMRLQHLVIHSDLRVRTAAMRAVANLALNTTNQREMEVCKLLRVFFVKLFWHS